MRINNINSLIAQLIAVIVSYHDSQRHISSKKLTLLNNISLEDYATKLASSPLGVLRKELVRIIKEITDGYDKQANLLDFLNGHILYLKAVQESKGPINFTQTMNHISQFLEDLCKILQTYDGVSVSVHYLDEGRVIVRNGRGLAQTVTYCRSGQNIIELVLKPLQIDCTEKDQKLTDSVKGQVTILLTPYIAAYVSQLEGRVAESEAEVSELKDKLQQSEARNEELTSSQSQSESQNAQLREENKVLLGRITGLNAENERLRLRVSERSEQTVTPSPLVARSILTGSGRLPTLPNNGSPNPFMGASWFKGLYET